MTLLSLMHEVTEAGAERKNREGLTKRMTARNSELLHKGH